MDPNLVILAGGISSRMRKSQATHPLIDSRLIEEAHSKSKTMISVGDKGRPFMDYLLYNVREAGYRNIVIVIGEHDDHLRKYYGKSDSGNKFHGLTISYAIQPIPAERIKPLGTADALHCALHSRPDWKGKKLTVCNSDNLYSVSVFRLLLNSPHTSAMIDYDRDALEFEKSRVEHFAVIQKDNEGWLTNIVEKPSKDVLAKMTDSTGRVGVSMNIFRFTYDTILPFLNHVPLHPVRQEKEIPSAIMLMLEREKDKHVMMTYPVAELVPDLTSKDDIAKVREYLLRMYPNFTLER
jgi:NDP-sugar pyrophosphorylase family protein